MEKTENLFEVIIDRTYLFNETLGDSIVLNTKKENIFDFKTIELPWLNNKKQISCISEDTYIAVKHISPTFGECFLIKDVPGRSFILIHKGNFVGSLNPRTGKPDTKGCILPGKAHIDIDGDKIPDVTSSGPTMKKLLEILPDKFYITFRKAENK